LMSPFFFDVLVFDIPVFSLRMVSLSRIYAD
jgi:hypothetical protein